MAEGEVIWLEAGEERKGRLTEPAGRGGEYQGPFLTVRIASDLAAPSGVDVHGDANQVQNTNNGPLSRVCWAPAVKLQDSSS